MNLFTRQSARLLAVGGIITGSVLGSVHPAWALTQEEVVGQLRSVPVFTITDSNGVFLVSEVEGEEGSAPVAPVFIDQDDAERFLGAIQNSEAEIPSDVQITPVSLGVIYAAAIRGQDPDNRLEFEFIPSPEESRSAVEVLQNQLEQQGEDPSEIDSFAGVPLFAACRDDGESCLSTLFFSYNEFQSEFQAFVENAGEDSAQVAEEFSPSVISLEEFIQVLETSDDEDLSEFRLVPTPEARQAVQEAQEAQSQEGGAAPAQ